MSFDFNIIIPVYNEGENLIKVINHLKKKLKEIIRLLFVMTMTQTIYFNS